MKFWQRITVLFAKTVIIGLRLIGRHGTALPGLVAERLYPGLLSKLIGQLEQGVVLITGTNGKTTTAKIARTLLEHRNLRVLSNRSGSNFTRGILASVMEQATWSGRLEFDIAVFEVDEAYARLVAREVKPVVIVVLNVMRDQLDRYGEIDKTAKLIGQALEQSHAAVLNANDRPVADLGTKLNDDKRTTYFGVSPQLQTLLPSDEGLLVGPMKSHRQPSPDVLLRQFDVSGQAEFLADGLSHKTNLQFSGIHNAQNATAALALINHLYGAIDPGDMIALSRVRPAFGRGEEVIIHGVKARLALIKNPSGFNQNLKAFCQPKVGGVLIIINDRYADSRDVSWLWDVDLSPLSQIAGRITVSGARAYDMALRLQYEGMLSDPEMSLSSALKRAIDATPLTKELLILPTYTAMLEARRLLSKTAELEKIWQ
ncbi:MAG TPA: MurT ligase domain-containing protein [Candidatus Saccharimonadales bacterium]